MKAVFLDRATVDSDDLNLEPLREPISSELPCGENLEYDNAFMSLEEDIKGKPEKQMGSEVIAGVPPDWRKVKKGAVDLAARTKDLRVLIANRQFRRSIHRRRPKRDRYIAAPHQVRR